MSKKSSLELLKHNAPQSLGLLEHCIRHKSWWDTVDGLASKLVGCVVGANAELLPVMEAWNRDPDLWIRRASLLYQLKYKPPQLDLQRQFCYVRNLMGEEDFFIRKAIGWVLREHSKIDQPTCDAVKEFITAHQSQLSSLSIREGSKYLNPTN